MEDPGPPDHTKSYRKKITVALRAFFFLVGVFLFGATIGLYVPDNLDFTLANVPLFTGVSAHYKKLGQYQQQPSEAAPVKSHIHLLIPASGSNVDLCKNLLSTAILSYPVPVLAGWNATGKLDASKSHLAKILSIGRSLESIHAENGDDLVLIVDGYDLWFQLRPDVLIQRYYSINEAANTRLALEFGRDMVHKHDIRQTIIFGPDKLCWPIDYRRPACWAAPESAFIPKDAFGPSTDDGDMEHMRPRWLNSGTILGPVGDVGAMIDATVQKMTIEYNTQFEDRDSDQYYMANLFGEQEYARQLLRPKEVFADLNVSSPNSEPESYSEDRPVKRSLDDKLNLTLGGLDVPVLEHGQKTEFHIGIDYESSIFQTSAGYGQYISWMKYNRTYNLSEVPGGPPADIPHQIDIPDDILSSPPPFLALQRQNASLEAGPSNSLGNHSWRDMPLGTNVATKKIFALFHMTGDKGIRNSWWPKMWYYPYAEALLNASTRLPVHPFTVTNDGREWWPAGDMRDYEQLRGQRKGAWSDTGEWLPWDELCGAHRELLFGKQD